MARYQNPNHPAGPLYPQDTGLTRGGGGWRQSGHDPAVLVDGMFRERHNQYLHIAYRRQLPGGGYFGRKSYRVKGELRPRAK